MSELEFLLEYFGSMIEDRKNWTRSQFMVEGIFEVSFIGIRLDDRPWPRGPKKALNSFFFVTSFQQKFEMWPRCKTQEIIRLSEDKPFSFNV